MVSKAQTNVMGNVLKIAGIRVIDYRIDPEMGIIISVEKEEKKAKCPHCGKETEKLHQNHWNTVRDLPWAGQTVYLKINRRQMGCDRCGKKFSEELEFVEKKRT